MLAETTETVPNWFNIAQLLGFPVLCLIFLGWGFTKIAKWIAPRVDDVIKGHVAFLTKTTETMALLSKNQQSLTDSQTRSAEMIEEIHSLIKSRMWHDRHPAPDPYKPPTQVSIEGEMRTKEEQK